MITKSKKQLLVDAANKELKRIGEMGEFAIDLDQHGRIAAVDESGYYPVKNYKTLVNNLKEFGDNVITDSLYDGDESHIWSELWSLFDA